MNKSRIIYWMPRVLGIAAILFISLFALDAFNSGESLSSQIADFGLHLIPSGILLVFLLVAWKWEKAGSLLFILTGLVLSPFVFRMNYFRLLQFQDPAMAILNSLLVISMITLPLVVIGLLFFLSSRMRNRAGGSGDFLFI